MLHAKDPGARQSISEHLSSATGKDLSFPSDTEFSTVDNLLWGQEPISSSKK